MPDENGNFRGITVPELPWQKDKRADDLQAFKARGGGLHFDPEPQGKWFGIPATSENKRHSASEA